MEKLQRGVSRLLYGLLLAILLIPCAHDSAAAGSDASLRETRDELRGVSRIQELRNSDSAAEQAEQTPMSTDQYAAVPIDHWAYPALRHLSEQGLISGYPSDFFQADRPLTRYEFAEVMSTLLPLEAADSESQLAVTALRLEFSDQLVSLEQELDELALQLASLQQRMGKLQTEED